MTTDPPTLAYRDPACKSDPGPNQLTLARRAGTEIKMTSQGTRKLQAKDLIEREIGAVRRRR